MPAKTYTLKEILEIFDNIKSAKNIMLEANPNLQKSTKIRKGSFHILSCMPRIKRQALFKLHLISFYKEIKHYNTPCF